MHISYNNTVVHVCENDAIVIEDDTRVNTAPHETTILKSITEFCKPIVSSLFQSIKTLIESQDIRYSLMISRESLQWQGLVEHLPSLLPEHTSPNNSDPTSASCRVHISMLFLVKSLAGNVGNMSATCRQHVKKSPNLGWHACRCQHKKYPDTRILRRKSPTKCRYCSTYRYCNPHLL